VEFDFAIKILTVALTSDKLSVTQLHYRAPTLFAVCDDASVAAYDVDAQRINAKATNASSKVAHVMYVWGCALRVVAGMR
jgi:hypothetical protein